MTEGTVISLEMIEIEMGNRGSKSYVPLALTGKGSCVPEYWIFF